MFIGAAIYGGMSLNTKWNEVKELNGQIADASEPDGKEPDDQEPGGQPDDQAIDPSNTDESVSPKPSSEAGSPQENNPEPEVSQSPGSKSPATDASPPTTPKPSPSPGGANDGGGAEDDTLSPEEKEKLKKEIDASTASGMEQLRASCKASSSSLVQQIVQELNNNEEASLQTIQKEFLTSIIAAEAECDVKFNLLAASAKEQYKGAGISEESLPDWSTEYGSAKEQARADALVAIAGAID